MRKGQAPHMVSLIQRPATLTEIALHEIRTAIVEGTLPLGSALSEGQLATSLGISKTPVREALAQLRMEGLVTIVPQSGTFVFTPSAAEVSEICEFRQTLEAAALRLSIAGDRSRLIDGLAEVCVGMDKAHAAGDEITYLRLDAAFHELFFSNAGNRYLADAYARLMPKVKALSTHLAARPEHTQCYEEHMQILDAIRRRNEREYMDILSRHIVRIHSTYTRNIEDTAAAPPRSFSLRALRGGRNPAAAV
jgi:DNA-binding GntR family transcriptional regulator